MSGLTHTRADTHKLRDGRVGEWPQNAHDWRMEYFMIAPLVVPLTFDIIGQVSYQID
jgi:hypothetical protein